MPAPEHSTPVTIAADGKVARVIQITDPHLMADESGSLLGVTTRDSLAAVVRAAREYGSAPDLLLATGDLAQDGSESAYHEFEKQVSVLGCAQSWVAGNHDDTNLLTRVAQGYNAANRHFLLGAWQVVVLDSSLAGEVRGHLADSELAFLDQALTAYPDRPALVALHHHPIDITARWMKEIGLDNRQAFWRIVEGHPQVKAVLWGHIHQELDQTRGDVRLLATPSTCIQFEPASRDFSVEPLAPGFRWLDLHSDGSLESGVVRATDFTYDLDTDSDGY